MINQKCDSTLRKKMRGVLEKHVARSGARERDRQSIFFEYFFCSIFSSVCFVLQFCPIDFAQVVNSFGHVATFACYFCSVSFVALFCARTFCTLIFMLLLRPPSPLSLASAAACCLLLFCICFICAKC